MNNYDILAPAYSKTDAKPDKKYSMAPTAAHIIGDLHDKTVTDIGCGSGFFSRIFARDAKSVIGVDNSIEQITRANQHPVPNIEFILGDATKMNLPQSHAIFVPFVLNYMATQVDLANLIHKCSKSLLPSGIVAGIVDMPKRPIHDMRRFGSVKRAERLFEGSPMEVELYSGGHHGGEHLLTLHSTYHPVETIQDHLQLAGFSDITWHTPMISNDGLKELGYFFWRGYLENCDVAYFTARK